MRSGRARDWAAEEKAMGGEWPLGAGEMAERIRLHPWSATSVGSTGTWPHALRVAVDIMLASPGPVSILWGPDRLQFYNDAYIPFTGDRHPRGLGRPAAEAATGEPHFGAALDRAFAGESVPFEDWVLPIRNAGRENDDERHFSGSFVPVRDETGAVCGVIHNLT